MGYGLNFVLGGVGVGSGLGQRSGLGFRIGQGFVLPYWQNKDNIYGKKWDAVGVHIFC